jgi:hypothetical protein
MKNLLLCALFLITISSFAQSDEQAVKDVVSKAYVGGIHNGGPIDDIRQGFHPSFAMLRLMENDVKPLTIAEWITNIEKNRAQNPAAPAVKTTEKFVSVTVAGTAANAVVELSRNDKKIFTDNLLLYKFTEGWRIVSKTFYRHP